jgi:hypothetical protein
MIEILTDAKALLIRADGNNPEIIDHDTVNGQEVAVWGCVAGTYRRVLRGTEDAYIRVTRTGSSRSTKAAYDEAYAAWLDRLENGPVRDSGRPATAKQLAYLRRLIARTGGLTDSSTQPVTIPDHCTSRQASDLIDLLRDDAI